MCRSSRGQSLERYLQLQPVIDGVEGTYTKTDGMRHGAIKLIGNVPANGKAPGGLLRHKGWKAEKVDLPALAPGERARSGRDRSRIVRSNEHRHRPRHHQFRARLHRSADAAKPDYPDDPRARRPAVRGAGPRRSRGARCRRSCILGDQEYVGVYAREQGALVPTKSVHSAKSWLSNPEVDRTAKILPWDAQEGGRVLSPVEVSTRDLEASGGCVAEAARLADRASTTWC